MYKIFKIAIRNLQRYTRRTALTALLIVVGLVMVVLFSGLAGSFKNMMIGLITDSNLGHLQIHKKGYVSSIDTLPLYLNLSPKMYSRAIKILEQNKEIASFAPRIKLGCMISNFAETTNVKITAIDPEKELQVSPAIVDRLVTDKKGQFLRSGEIILPEKIAKGMHIKRGDTVVLVATNKDGSVNGMQFVVSGIIQSIIGPQGKDGYITIQDARKLLRIKKTEVSEIVVRIKNFSRLKKVVKQLKMEFARFKNKKGKPVFEVHAWSDLSPFTNIAGMIDLMTITVKIIMIAIVLISVLNVMLMSVYERVREIGTLSAMGTSPAKILLLFVSEGLALGLLGAIIGNILGLGLLWFLRVKELTFSFGMMKNLVLKPEFNWSELLVLNLIVLLISVLASFQPAWKASRMEPAEALRQV